MARKVLIEGIPKISLTWKNPALFVFWTRQLKLSLVQPLMYLNFPLGSWFRWILCFSMLKASVYLSRTLWIYVLLFHITLNIHPESNFQLLKSSNFLSMHWGIKIRKLHYPSWWRWSTSKIFWIIEDISQHEHHSLNYSWRFILSQF